MAHCDRNDGSWQNGIAAHLRRTGGSFGRRLFNSSILYLSGKDKDFNIDSEKNILAEKLKVKENEEKSNNLIIKQYEMYALKDIENLKNGISGCDEKIARLKELQKKASIFSEFSPNGVEKDLNEWRKKIENYQERLELLYQMNEENSARVYFKEYS